MANGVAHALRLVPEIAPPTVADKLAEAVQSLSFDPQFGGAEGWIGAIIIELLDVATTAVREIGAGGLGPLTRSQGGDLISGLVVLRSKLGEREFAAAVHRVGRTRRGVPLSMAVKDDIIEVVDQVATQAAAMN